MAISFRFYLFDDTSAIKRVPRRVTEGLTLGTDAIPEYARTRQRIAQVVVENEHGKPVRILDATGHFWTFDADGKITEGLQESSFAAMELAFAAEPKRAGKVVDLRPDLKRKNYREKYRWDLTAEDLERITADLWPHLANAAEVATVKGKASRRPPLTHEAKRAIDEIYSKLAGISTLLEDLSEPALKGFVFEAERVSKAYSENSHIWSAVAREADQKREIKARHRTGKGTFYAVLRIWMSVGRYESREVNTISVRCDGKAAAIEAARRLLAQHAENFSDEISIEPEILSDLEWSSEDEDTLVELQAG
jgi:hypothetical protein